MRKKTNDWFYFSFYGPSWFFYDPSPILFYFCCFIRSESIRVDPTWNGGPNFCTCLAKMFICPVPKIPHVMMKWCCRASYLGRFTAASELHILVDLLCGIAAATELHISVDLLCGTTDAELHNSVDFLCGTTDAELHNSPVNLLVAQWTPS